VTINLVKVRTASSLPHLGRFDIGPKAR